MKDHWGERCERDEEMKLRVFVIEKKESVFIKPAMLV